MLNAWTMKKKNWLLLFPKPNRVLNAGKPIYCGLNQDECRLDILSSLSASSILLVLDWAMKYLPRKYRESQSDWFSKRGISWHIAAAIKSNSGEMEMMTFVHVFESATAQDSS